MYKLVEVKWAEKVDLSRGQLWRNWNKDNKLPGWFWQRVWEYPWVFSRVENKNSVLDVGGTYPAILLKQFPSAKSVDSRDLNVVGHFLHDGLWPEGSLIVSDARRIPLDDKAFENVISISALEEMPQPEQVISEMLRIASRRVIITCDVGGSGITVKDFEALFAEWGIKFQKSRKLLTSLSPIIMIFGQRPTWKNRKIRVCGVVLDRIIG